MDLTKLNSIAANQYLPKKAILDLPINKLYQVTSLREVRTMYGVKSVITLDDEFQVFLPARIHKLLSDDPEQASNFRAEIEKNSLRVKHIGNRCLEFKIDYIRYNPLNDGFDSD